jgi:hypothetical protein
MWFANTLEKYDFKISQDGISDIIGGCDEYKKLVLSVSGNSIVLTSRESTVTNWSIEELRDIKLALEKYLSETVVYVSDIKVTVKMRIMTVNAFTQMVSNETIRRIRNNVFNNGPVRW